MHVAHMKTFTRSDVPGPLPHARTDQQIACGRAHGTARVGHTDPGAERVEGLAAVEGLGDTR
jgi:hypothetical protein